MAPSLKAEVTSFFKVSTGAEGADAAETICANNKVLMWEAAVWGFYF